MQSIGKKKIIHLTNLNLFFDFKVLKSIIFSFLANYKKKMSTETYGDFRIDYLNDESGQKLWGDNLFLNIYDFWCICQDGFLLKDYKTKNSLLKRIIRKKLRGYKELPTYKVLLRMLTKKRNNLIRWSF